MYLHRKDSDWLALAPAKVNLYLEVLGRRFDGFHELETLMVPLGIYDSLCLTPLQAGAATQAGPIELAVRSPEGSGLATDSVPTDEGNLVVSALQLLQQRSGCEISPHPLLCSYLIKSFIIALEASPLFAFTCHV